MAIITPESLIKSLGPRLKAERKRLEWSRDKMAKIGEVSRATQRLYDISARQPPLLYLYRLGSKGADLGYLLFGDSARITTVDSLVVSKEAAHRMIKMAADMLLSDQIRVTTSEQVAELSLSLLQKIHDAESPEVDFEELIPDNI